MNADSQQLPGVQILGARDKQTDEILTPEALNFIVDLERRFGPRRRELLAARVERQAKFDAGARPDFLPETAEIRKGDWKVAPLPADLLDRRVEITGPVDRKMVINALNSGASVYMADFEDANTPTWSNLIEGHINLRDAVRRTITYTDPTSGKDYKLNPKTAVLLVRPRGWHLPEKHVLVDGKAMSGSLFDFGLFFWHNAKEQLARGTGPYFYLPKLESHLEARLWNDVFLHAQQALGLKSGTIKATVLIETILATFEMDEILYELREHSAGLNAGRWDYIFSYIKKFPNDPHTVLPDPGLVALAKEVFDRHMPKANQIERKLADFNCTAADLLGAPEGEISEAGVKQNIAVSIGYLESWLRGIGCVPLFNLMEDAATAEISRAQLWQWIHHKSRLSDGRPVTLDLCLKMIDEELAKARQSVGDAQFRSSRYNEAAEILRDLIQSPRFVEFLTLPAYEKLNAAERASAGQKS